MFRKLPDLPEYIRLVDIYNVEIILLLLSLQVFSPSHLFPKIRCDDMRIGPGTH